MQSEPVKFYSTSGNTSFLSNFASYPIELDGKVWPTVEHYFQAQKFLDESYREEIRKAKAPYDAKRMGRGGPLRRNWDNMKIGIMKLAVRRKFETYSELREKLLRTGERELVEDSPNDYFWGNGRNGTGHNHMGKILMGLRQEFREEDRKKQEEQNKSMAGTRGYEKCEECGNWVEVNTICRTCCPHNEVVLDDDYDYGTVIHCASCGAENFVTVDEFNEQYKIVRRNS